MTAKTARAAGDAQGDALGEALGEALGKEAAGDVVARLADVRRRIAAAAAAAGRDPDTVQLVAVTKTFGPEHILPVLAAGHRTFAENRVQEAAGKWPALRAAHPLSLHLIGPLQSNKVRDAVRLFDAIHTIDRPKIAAAIADEMARQGRTLALFLQVNTGAEPQKSGVAPEAAPALLAFCRDRLRLPICGLMCIPPLTADPAAHFATLAALAAELGLGHLSMGMSADFEVAIAHGATHVRIGSQIFGSRPQPR
jgi:pyridoxal phosphate enzyme (YggS family)